MKQEDDLKASASTTPPRSTRGVGAWTLKQFGLVYESLARFADCFPRSARNPLAEGARRSGLIALLHRLGLAYHKPDAIPRKRAEEKQKAFIASFDNLLNSLADNEAVVFADAVHPPSVIAYHDHFAHAARPAGGFAPRQEKPAIEQTSGRRRLNIPGAIDL